MSPREAALAWTSVLFVALSAAGCASNDPATTEPAAAQPAPAEAVAAAPAPAPDPGPVSGVVEKTKIATATVLMVDAPSRRVRLRGENGNEFVVVCGEEVRNLPQVKVGDIVTCEYREAVAYEVKKPGDPISPTTLTAAASRAKEGQMPGAAAGQALRVTAAIVAIDREMKRVSLQGPEGAIVVVQVKDADKLSRVSVGEFVELTYTESIAVSVSSPAAK